MGGRVRAVAHDHQGNGNGRMTFISVVVPFHGPEPWLGRCLDSLLSQRYPAARREFLFVDNGASAEARLLVARHPAVRLLDAPPLGAYVARNVGLRAAIGNVIAFTDADCAASPNWLESIATTMADPTAGVVLGSYRPAADRFTASILADYENEKNRFVCSSTDYRLLFGYTNNMAVRAALFRSVGPFIERWRGSDSLFVQRVAERYGASAVRFDPAMWVQHFEVLGLVDYYRKVFVHSRSIAAMASLGPQRPLTARERLDVYARTVRSRNDSLGEAVLLLAMLAGGLGAWGLGAMAGGTMRPTTPHARRPVAPVLEREVPLHSDLVLGGAADVAPAHPARHQIPAAQAANSIRA